MVNGDKLPCNSVCRGFEWTMQGDTLQKRCTNYAYQGVRIDHGNGMTQLSGVLKWDFPKMQMEFAWNGGRVVLQAEEAESVQMKEGKVSHSKDKVGVFLMQEDQEQRKEIGNKQETTIPKGIITLLEKFQHLFEKPKTLPPHRSQDHYIPLAEGVKEVIVRQSRHSSPQKDVIEEWSGRCYMGAD